MATAEQQRLTEWWKTEPFTNPGPQTAEHCCDALIALELLIADGHLLPPRNYFEPGCCLGRNLRLLHERYGGDAYGLEVHHELVTATEAAVPGVRMFIANVFDVDRWATNLVDRYFDLTLTRSFLFYLPPGLAKCFVVEELKRVSKFLLVMEPNFTNTGRWGPEDRGSYVCSWEHWEDYGLRPYPNARAAGLGVYIWP